jgi:hypothetical protein
MDGAQDYDGGFLRYDGGSGRGLERCKCSRGQQCLPALDLQRHKLDFQAQLLSFSLFAFELDPVGLV